MEFPVKTGAPARQKTACAIVPVFEGGALKGPAREIDLACGGLLRRLVKSRDASSDLGRCLLVPQLQGAAAERALLIGCGKSAAFDAKRFKQVSIAAAQALKGTGIREAISYLPATAPKDVSSYYAGRLTVEATRGALYGFNELKTSDNKTAALTKLAIGVSESQALGAVRGGVKHGQAIANGTGIARDLGNRPPNVCTPTHLAKEAQAIARRHRNLRTEVLGETEIKRLKMGALLSVTRGATEPVRLIVMHYAGGDPKQAPVALCGKGITFDTGGISLKPPPRMDEMKFDMCGAASVIGTMAVLGELQPEINVVAVVPACENMPSGKATRPGDIVTTMSGKTVEILNTDAEGRLILCDAITYARRFKPRYLLDVATLTGACVIAVGHLYTGLFSNNENLADMLLEAGKRSLDPAWRLPADEEYGDALKSNFADFANAGTREGGASIAANYLSRFVEDTPWAHLDIAGVAWKVNAEKGATGRIVPLLSDFLLNL
jgi:leucyl aminopeptidase